MKEIVVAAKEAQAAERAESGKSIYDQLTEIQVRTLAVLEAAGDDHVTLLKAVAECRKNLELMAKLTGELDTRSQVNVGLKIDFSTLTDQQLLRLADGEDPHAVLG